MVRPIALPSLPDLGLTGRLLVASIQARESRESVPDRGARLPPIDGVCVPAEELRVGRLEGRQGSGDLAAVERVVVPAVFELLANPAADLEAKVGRDRDVPVVEQQVEVAAQQEAVAAANSIASMNRKYCFGPKGNIAFMIPP